MSFYFLRKINLMRLFLLVILFLGLVFNPSTAVASTDEDNKIWQSILGDMAEKAMNGDAESQAIIGAFLLEGAGGLPQDVELAFSYLRMAADQKNARAEYSLYRAYENGIGVSVNKKTALMWLEKSSKHGDRDALTILGWKYDKGEDVEQNLYKAVELFEKAAKKGQPRAQHFLGINHYAGYGGLSVNDIEAYAWIDIAIRNPLIKNFKNKSGDSLLPMMIEHRDTMPKKNLSPDDLIKAKKKSDEYYKLYVEPFN